MSPRHSARFALVALLCFFSAALAVRPSAAQTIIDYAPIVSAPDSIDGVEGAALSFDVSAVDINEEAITSFTASGSAIDAGAVFTVTSPYYSTGHLSWTPGFAQAGHV